MYPLKGTACEKQYKNDIKIHTPIERMQTGWSSVKQYEFCIKLVVEYKLKEGGDTVPINGSWEFKTGAMTETNNRREPPYIIYIIYYYCFTV